MGQKFISVEAGQLHRARSWRALCVRVHTSDFTFEQRKTSGMSQISLYTVYSGDSAEDRTVSSNIEAGKPISSLSERY